MTNFFRLEQRLIFRAGLGSSCRPGLALFQHVRPAVRQLRNAHLPQKFWRDSNGMGGDQVTALDQAEPACFAFGEALQTLERLIHHSALLLGANDTFGPSL